MRVLLAFFTALPVRGGPLEDAARSVHLLPLVGLFTGFPAAAAALLAACVLPPGVAAALALGAALLAAGLHHTDGVLDVGDALMVRGSHERRRAVLKDARVGVGGIGALFLIYAPALAALAALAASPARAALALLAAEVSARSAMLLVLAFGKPAEDSSSSVPFVRALTGKRRVFGAALALLLPVVLSLPLGPVAACAALSAPTAAFVGLGVSRRAFGGINGDAAGATGELARTVLLVAISATS